MSILCRLGFHRHEIAAKVDDSHTEAHWSETLVISYCPRCLKVWIYRVVDEGHKETECLMPHFKCYDEIAAIMSDYAKRGAEFGYSPTSRIQQMIGKPDFQSLLVHKGVRDYPWTKS